MRFIKILTAFAAAFLCFCVSVHASDVTLTSAKINNNGVLTVKGNVGELEKEQYLTVVICPVENGSCKLDDILLIDQQLITDNMFEFSFQIQLSNGVYAARIGGNGINNPQYLIISIDNDVYEIKLGDVDGNGVIEAADSVVLLQYVLNKAAVILSPLQLKAANVTGSDVLTAEDAAWILQKTLNGSVIFPAEQ